MDVLTPLQSSAICPDGESQKTCGVDWSPSDDRFVMGGNSKVLRMVSSDGSQLWAGSGHTDWIRALRWAPEGGFVATGSDDRTVRIWNADTGACDKVLKGAHDDWVRAVDVAPDGQHVASGADDKKVVVWDVASGEQKWAQQKHTGYLYSMRFSPDGEKLASGGGGDRKVRVWNAENGTLLHALQGHDGDVYGLAWAPDGSQLASLDSSGNLILWDPDGGSQNHKFSVKGGGNGLAWSPDGANLLVANSNGVVVVQADDGRVLQTVSIGSAESVALSPDGQHVVAGLGGAGVRTFSVDGAGPPMAAAASVDVGDEVHPALPKARGRCLGQLEVTAGDHAPSIALSPNGQQLLVGRPTGLGVWNLGAKVGVAKEWSAHSGEVLSVAWSSNKLLASGGEDACVRLWSADDHTERHALQGHAAAICALHFSPDGTRLASGDAQGNVRVWDTASGQCVQTLQTPEGWVRAVAWSPCGRMLAATHDSGGVLIWDSAEFAVAHDLRGHSGWVHGVSWRKGSKHLVTCGEDMQAIIWDLSKGGQTPLEGHTGAVFGVAWSSSGARIVTTGGDQTIRQWDPQRGKQVSSTTDKEGYPEKVVSMNSFCITSHTDGYIFGWSL